MTMNFCYDHSNTFSIFKLTPTPDEMINYVFSSNNINISNNYYTAIKYNNTENMSHHPLLSIWLSQVHVCNFCLLFLSSWVFFFKVTYRVKIGESMRHTSHSRLYSVKIRPATMGRYHWPENSRISRLE